MDSVSLLSNESTTTDEQQWSAETQTSWSQTQQPLLSEPHSGTSNNAMQQPAGLQQPLQMQSTVGPGQTFGPPPAYPPPVPYAYCVPQGSVPDLSRMGPQGITPVAYVTPSQLAAYYNPTYQQTAGCIFVQEQPTAAPISSTVVQPSSGDNYFTLSIIMTILVVVLGGWLSILCTAAATLISYSAKEEEKRGNVAAARSKANISLGLNLTAIAFTIVVWAAVAVPIAVTVSTSTTPTTSSPSANCGQYGCYTASCSRSFSYSPYSTCYYSFYYSYSPSSYSTYYSNSYYAVYCSCNSYVG